MHKQIAITKINNKTVLAYIEDNIIYDILMEDIEDSVGNIYLAKVKNIVKNINAAFVQIDKDNLAYLYLNAHNKNDLKNEDEVLVQVTKAPVKTKQAVVTNNLELVGKFVVLSLIGSEKNISKKIEDENKILELSEFLNSISDIPYNIVLRTNSQKAEIPEIRKECYSLAQKMNDILSKAKYIKPLNKIYTGQKFYTKYINDTEIDSLDRIITDDKDIYEELKENYNDLIVYYEDDTYPLRNLLNIENQINKALEKKVWLKSGGNILIEHTEAMTVIDVNSGKAIGGKRNIESTFLKINKEAASQIARQLRLRNISGMILVDFIDMKKKDNQKEFINHLKAELKKDKTSCKFIDITKLGIVEITRMKQYKPLYEVYHK